MIDKNNYSDSIKESIEECGNKILNEHTSSERPGMLLGKIQSGKTKTFIEIMSYLFNEGFDIGIVLTKGTTALATKTYERMSKEFEEMIAKDIVKVFDIINMLKDKMDLKNWNGHAFWWTVLFMPRKIEKVIFSSNESSEKDI